MYDIHQDNNLLSPESWLLETMEDSNICGCVEVFTLKHSLNTWAKFIVAPTSIVKDSLSALLPLSAAEQKQPNKKELEKLFAWSDFNVQHIAI